MPPHAYDRSQHEIVARALKMLRTDFFLQSQCWFAGGTAIVMKNGEYRLSLDVDFLCSSLVGYRELREAVTLKGAAGLFEQPVKTLKDFRCDQYGIRTMLEVEGQPLKFEIVREARIELDGAYDPELACPLLAVVDQFAEKMLANSDRGKDPSANYRDVFDLGILVAGHGGRIPAAASKKAVEAYGETVWLDLKWVVDHLRARPSALTSAAEALRMDPVLALKAVQAVSRGYEGKLPPDREGSEIPIAEH